VAFDAYWFTKAILEKSVVAETRQMMMACSPMNPLMQISEVSPADIGCASSPSSFPLRLAVCVPATDLQEGLEATLKAVQLDERNPYTHYALAIVSVFSERFEQSISAARKAIGISPSFALGHFVFGMALLFSGRASEAIAPLEYGERGELAEVQQHRARSRAPRARPHLRARIPQSRLR
jgi:tetratricopeptide (TPR) repeat protein